MMTPKQVLSRNKILEVDVQVSIMEQNAESHSRNV